MKRSAYAYPLSPTQLTALRAGSSLSFTLPPGYAPVDLTIDHKAIFGNSLETRTQSDTGDPEIFTLTVQSVVSDDLAAPPIVTTVATSVHLKVRLFCDDDGTLTGFLIEHATLTRTGTEPLPPGVIRMGSDPPHPG